MKSLAGLLSLLFIASCTTALPHELQSSFEVHPGFDIDLSVQRLVELDDHQRVWMTELEKIQTKARGIKFFDITDTQDLETFSHLRVKKFSYPSPNETERVRPILKTLSIKGPQENLAHFSSFRTRYYRSESGKASQQWLFAKIKETTVQYASESLQGLITFDEFPHPWAQSSIIARINGSSIEDDGIVIIGAHQDSTNLWPFLPAPGADDDGSGSVTILEAYRALLVADFRPIRTVEFHWYSAEEGGLLGSQAIARKYAADGARILAMSQFDMTAWVKRGSREEVGVIIDYVDQALTQFNKNLVSTYLDIPYVETKCGYACSDHASWNKAGYPSIFTIESSFENSNHHIHSTNDRIDISDEFSFSHMLEFSKLAVAFAVELGGWTESK